VCQGGTSNALLDNKTNVPVSLLFFYAITGSFGASVGGGVAGSSFAGGVLDNLDGEWGEGFPGLVSSQFTSVAGGVVGPVLLKDAFGSMRRFFIGDLAFSMNFSWAILWVLISVMAGSPRGTYVVILPGICRGMSHVPTNSPHGDRFDLGTPSNK